MRADAPLIYLRGFDGFTAIDQGAQELIARVAAVARSRSVRCYASPELPHRPAQAMAQW